MKLESPDDFGQAKRNNRIVLVYDLEDLDYVDEDDPRTSALAGRGYIMSFDENIVTIFNLSVGVLHFFRDKFEFWLEPVEER